MACTGYIFGVLAGTIKKILKKNVKKFIFYNLKKKKHIFKANILRLIFRLIRYVDFKFYVDKHKKINKFILT